MTQAESSVNGLF